LSMALQTLRRVVCMWIQWQLMSMVMDSWKRMAADG
jgi:hypothetical protein